MKRGQEHWNWQRRPSHLTTPRVQLWRAMGVMLTAQLTLAEARERVQEGTAFVITCQAIQLYEE